MKKSRVGFLVLMAVLAVKSPAQEKAPLRLLQTIPLPEGVHNHWEHFGVDVEGHRLFLGSEDAPVVEVFDLRTNKHIRAITGFGEPNNIMVRPDLNEIFVVDGGASEVKILKGDSYQVIGRTKLTIDADSIVSDPATKFLYVVNGGRAAHNPYCLLSIMDTTSGKKLADIRLDVDQLESMAIEKSGPRLFINMMGGNEIGVVDREKRALVQTWPLTQGKNNGRMALDEANHRLFVVTRTPPKLVVLDTETGKEITSLAVGGGAADMNFDPASKRIYVSCGAGFITVVEQRGANDYQVIGNIPTKSGAKNGILVPALGRYYVAVPKKGEQEAQVLVYEVVP